MFLTNRRTAFCHAFTLLFVASTLTGSVFAEEKKISTTVTVGEMCSGCVKRITSHFDKIKAVSEVKCDIKAKTVMLIPAKDVQLSPRKVWEIMESLGKKPVKLVSPDGTFTTKPKQS